MQGMFGILSGWREQYDRMRRSLDRLTAYAEGRSFADSNEARDALFHFFQDAYHLKDWLKNDVTAQKHAVEDLFGSKRPPGLLVMQLCADLCNGTKHLVLKSPRIAGTGFARQHVTVRPAAAGSGLPPDPPMCELSAARCDGVSWAGQTTDGVPPGLTRAPRFQYFAAVPGPPLLRVDVRYPRRLTGSATVEEVVVAFFDCGNKCCPILRGNDVRRRVAVFGIA
jgi:hypothetical protein